MTPPSTPFDFSVPSGPRWQTAMCQAVEDENRREYEETENARPFTFPAPPPVVAAPAAPQPRKIAMPRSKASKASASSASQPSFGTTSTTGNMDDRPSEKIVDLMQKLADREQKLVALETKCATQVSLYESANQTVEAVSRDADELRGSVNTLQDQLQSERKAHRKTREIIKGLEAEVKGRDKLIKEQEDTIAELKEQLEKKGNGGDNAHKRVSKIMTERDNFEVKYDEAYKGLKEGILLRKEAEKERDELKERLSSIEEEKEELDILLTQTRQELADFRMDHEQRADDDVKYPVDPSLLRRNKNKTGKNRQRMTDIFGTAADEEEEYTQDDDEPGQEKSSASLSQQSPAEPPKTPKKSPRSEKTHVRSLVNSPKSPQKKPSPNTPEAQRSTPVQAPLLSPIANQADRLATPPNHQSPRKSTLGITSTEPSPSGPSQGADDSPSEGRQAEPTPAPVQPPPGSPVTTQPNPPFTPPSQITRENLGNTSTGSSDDLSQDTGSSSFDGRQPDPRPATPGDTTPAGNPPRLESSNASEGRQSKPTLAPPKTGTSTGNLPELEISNASERRQPVPTAAQTGTSTGNLPELEISNASEGRQSELTLASPETGTSTGNLPELEISSNASERLQPEPTPLSPETGTSAGSPQRKGSNDSETSRSEPTPATPVSGTSAGNSPQPKGSNAPEGYHYEPILASPETSTSAGNLPQLEISDASERRQPESTPTTPEGHQLEPTSATAPLGDNTSGDGELRGGDGGNPPNGHAPEKPLVILLETSIYNPIKAWALVYKLFGLLLLSFFWEALGFTEEVASVRYRTALSATTRVYTPAKNADVPNPPALDSEDQALPVLAGSSHDATAGGNIDTSSPSASIGEGQVAPPSPATSEPDNQAAVQCQIPLPSRRDVFLAFCPHIIFYLAIMTGISAWQERNIWFAANGVTRTHFANYYSPIQNIPIASISANALFGPDGAVPGLLKYLGYSNHPGILFENYIYGDVSRRVAG